MDGYYSPQLVASTSASATASVVLRDVKQHKPVQEDFEDVAGILMTLKSATVFQSEGDQSELDEDSGDPNLVRSSRKRRKVQIYEDDEESMKEEDEYVAEPFEELDDDEYIDHRQSRSHSNRFSGGTRKKAPSGSACEKHRRWKKVFSVWSNILIFLFFLFILIKYLS